MDQGNRELDTEDVDLWGIMRQLFNREPIFHRPEFGTKRADFERMMADDFWETGASGRQYSREEVLEVLERRYAEPHEDKFEIFEVRCQVLAADLYLLTYTLLQDKARLTRRATIWRREHGEWKIVYHQGTMVQEAMSQS